MSPRIRKLVGVVAFVVYLGVYLLVAMAVGARHVNTAHGLIQLAYYVAAGLAWLPGAMALIRWMSRPPASGDADRA